MRSLVNYSLKKSYKDEYEVTSTTENTVRMVEEVKCVFNTEATDEESGHCFFGGCKVNNKFILLSPS